MFWQIIVKKKVHNLIISSEIRTFAYDSADGGKDSAGDDEDKENAEENL